MTEQEPEPYLDKNAMIEDLNNMIQEYINEEKSLTPTEALLILVLEELRLIRKEFNLNTEVDNNGV